MSPDAPAGTPGPPTPGGSSTLGGQAMRRRVFMNRGSGLDPEHEEFYRKCHCSPQEAVDFLFPVALHLTGNIHDAEDLVHDLLLKLLIWPGSAEPVRNSRAFLKTSLVRLFIDRILRTDRPIPVENVPDSAVINSGPEERAITKKILQNFWKEASSLNEIHREVVRLRFSYTLSIQRTHSEIAAELSIPVGTVARRLHDALKTLRRRLSGGMRSGQGYEY
jgi:RNA polymerase sigma factor (sigma-70 family)